MSDPILLGLPSADQVAALDASRLPALALHLAALQATVAARLAGLAAPSNGHSESEPEHLLDVVDAAQRLRVSTGWLYKNARRLPFTRRIGSRTLRFSEAGIRRYLATRRPS